MQQQDTRKNYIGIVDDTSREERVADYVARSQPRVVNYLVGRLAAVLKRRGKSAPGHAMRP